MAWSMWQVTSERFEPVLSRKTSELGLKGSLESLIHNNNYNKMFIKCTRAWHAVQENKKIAFELGQNK